MGESNRAPESASLHTRRAAALFFLKRAVLQLQRWHADARASLQAAPLDAERGDYPALLAEHQSPLWTEEALAERRLQCGKVQNLRVAIPRLNGALLPAGTTFSFWKQVEPPTAARGFVAGRELREGCLIPAIGGGICQLSNALYAIALDAGAEIVERHAHSRAVPGSAAEAGRDATVAWNYIDLRFRIDAPVRIEASLTHDTLTVRLWAQTPRPAMPTKDAPLSGERGRRWELLTPTPRSCVQCGEDACFRHAPELAEKTDATRTTYLLFRPNAEFERFVAQSPSDEGALLLPLANRRLAAGRYAFPSGESFAIRAAAGLTLRQMVAARWMARREKNAARRARRRMEADALAARYARLLRPEETHLIVEQELLPFLWRRGTLGGRTFDVFATQMPLTELQARLDATASRHPESRSLNDFRVPAWEGEAESAAFAAARRILTPHPELVRHFGERAVAVPWVTADASPELKRSDDALRFVLFLGPTIGRKGCYEVRKAALALHLPVVALGRCLEGVDFWQGVDVRQLSSDADLPDNPAVVVQPSLWEARPPRTLLDALAAGIPVVVTPGCGLGERDGVVTVSFGDSAALTAAIADCLKKSQEVRAIE